MFKDALVHRDKHSLCSRLKRSITDLPLLYSFINVKHYLFIGNRLTAFYYPTLLRRVQITRETSTNITRYLYSSHSPDRAKDKKP